MPSVFLLPMKTLLFFFISTFVTYAQVYVPDQIIIDNVTYDYRFHHMEQYFKHRTNKRPAINIDSTALNRNYVATFSIENNKLYIKDLKIKATNASKTYTKSVIKTLFNNENEKHLNWINGLYYVGTGRKLEKQIDTLHIEYSDYIVFELKKGEVVRKDYFTNRQMKIFQNYQFERFSKTKEYQKLIDQLKEKTNMTDWEIDIHIRKNIIYYSRRNQLK